MPEATTVACPSARTLAKTRAIARGPMTSRECRCASASLVSVHLLPCNVAASKYVSTTTAFTGPLATQWRLSGLAG